MIMAKKNNTGETYKRKLIFIRHSRAEDQSIEISDFERSLTVKGKVHSRLMAEILKSRGEEPGRVISSPAFRALETALIFCREYGISASEIRLSSELYHGLREAEFLPFIRKQDDSDQTVTLFGHNPLITGMAAFFAADEPDVLPKTGIYCLEFEAGSWSEVEPESGRTLYFLTPRELA
jgi:phosphohistidine phosphatase